MKNLSKLTYLLFFSFFFVLCTLYFALHPMGADADDNPIPPKTPCIDTEDPEFNSLRPYQASPCGKSPQSKFCGNKIIITESKDAKETFPESNNGCDPTKKVNWVNNKDYWIDLSEVELPILGNTEQVKNSQNPNDQLNDAQKMNEYASWYLNGVINRAEYGDTKNTDTELVNFSGPINKLLPSQILEATRIKSIENATTEIKFTDPDSGEDITSTANHDQIVACASQFLPLIGHFKAVECYDGGSKKANGKVLRLSDWKDHLPPLLWDKKYIDNEEKYKEDRCEWQGGLYIKIPFTNFGFCGPNPLNPNYWADLYSYIPLANTADRQYKMPIFTTTIQANNGTTITSKDWAVLDKGEPLLYYPHAYEVRELSELLNKTYLSSTPSAVVDSKTSEINGYNPTDPNQCRTINVRSNKGDNLFPIGGDGEHDIGVHVNFKVEELPLVSCVPYTDQFGNKEYKGKYYGEVAIEIHTSPVQVPNADQIWQNTVSSETSTFRRIFPKVEKGAPVECIADIPAVSKAVYKPVEGTTEIGVKSLTNPEEKYDPLNAKIYFPHLGSVYEYFLKGIQTALRPKGYGDPIVNGTLCQNQEEEEKMCPDVPDSEVDSKYLGNFKTNFIDLANKWTTSCAGPDNNLAEECYNYVVSESQEKGVNPAFSLTMWLEESGSSNYCFLEQMYGAGKGQDFGINRSDVPSQNIVKQLAAFIELAQEKLCSGTTGFVQPIHGWLTHFRSTDYSKRCDPTDPCGYAYTYGGSCTVDGMLKDYGGIINIWQIVNNTIAGGCINNGRFAIDWPTSMSCP